MEFVRSPLRRGFSAKGIVAIVLTALIAALLWTTFSSPSAHAAGNATWSNGTLLFENHGYTKEDKFNDPTNTIPDNAIVYVTPIQADAGTTSRKVFVIYYSSGVDPPAEKAAKYVEFNISANGTYSNAANKQDITVTPAGQETEVSSCAVGGVGWIICPISVFLAEAMDNIFNILSDMIKVTPPILGDPNNNLYAAWNVMRSIANLAFVIIFIIIIYSQVTSLGVSNYGLKRLLPRLIIAAILVNVSFYIAALAIDISNILGYSIQNLLNTLREQLFDMTNDDLGNSAITTTWSAVATVILAGGGSIVGLGYFAAAGGLYLLIPLLLGLVVTIIFVVIILAARQAIIILLVIIAPLAFVANLLPNTEKWFEKWKDLFMTMLIFFPAFSLVFGGSQLAGQIIIQNAGDNIIMLLFGMAVQIAPLVITPLILKLSGSLLGRIAQLVNDPRKGAIDRSRNWANDRAEHARQQNIAKGARLRNPASWGASMVKAADFRKRRLKDNTDVWKQAADNIYHESEGYEGIHTRAKIGELDKERIENQNTAHLQGQVNKYGTELHAKTIEVEGAKVSVENATAQTASMVAGYRAGVYDGNGDTRFASDQRMQNIQRRMAENVIQTSAWKQSEQSSQFLQQRSISDRMRADEGLLNIAQGYGTIDQRIIGRERAEATAVATLTKLNKDARDNTITLMETKAVESRMSVKDYAVNLVTKQADSADISVRQTVSRNQLEAALEIAASDGQIGVFDGARASEYIDQDVVDAVVARNVGTFKGKGGFHVQAKPKLSLQRYLEKFNSGDADSNVYGTTEAEVRQQFKVDQSRDRLTTLSNTTSNHLADMKYGAFEKYAIDIKSDEQLLNYLNTNNEDDRKTAKRIFESLREGLTDDSTRASITDRLGYARDMEEAIRSKFFPNFEPLKLSETERAVAGGDKLPESMADNGDISDAANKNPNNVYTGGTPTDKLGS